jgi:hypothetical protein
MGQVLPAGSAPAAPAAIVVAAALAPAVIQPAPLAPYAPAPLVQVPHEHPLALHSPASRHAARVVVGVYRFAGFSILTLIVTLLLAYISSTVFYFFSHTWATPVAISPSDAKVVAMNTELSARQNERDALATQLKQAELDVAMHQRYQLAFVKTVRTDLAHRQYALGQLTALRGTAESASKNVTGTINGYASEQQKFLQKELDAGLIKQDDMTGGNFQQAEIQAQTIGLAEQQAEIDQRTTDLARETASLDAILDDKKQDQALSYDVLQIKQQYNQSKLALAQAMAVRDQVKAQMAREDALIATLKTSVYIKAIADKAMIAYVPYDNMDNVKAGAPLYRCKAGMLWCHRVGQVAEVLPGEVTFQHPHRDKQMRGQAVELQLASDELDAVQDDQLFVGSKPMLF